MGSRRFRTSGHVFLPPLGRDGRTAYPSVAPVGETHPEAQTRRDRETSATLRFRGASYCPSVPEVGVAAAPPMALSLRTSATARDTRPYGAQRCVPERSLRPEDPDSPGRHCPGVPPLTMFGPEVSPRGKFRPPKIVRDGTPPSIGDSATPTVPSRLSTQAVGRQIRNPKSEIRNSCSAGTCRMNSHVFKL